MWAKEGVFYQIYPLGFQRQSGSEWGAINAADSPVTAHFDAGCGLVPYSIQFWKMEKQLKIDVEKKQTM